MCTRIQSMVLKVICKNLSMIVFGKSEESSARAAPIEPTFDLYRQKYYLLSVITLPTTLNDCHSSNLAMRVRSPSPPCEGQTYLVPVRQSVLPFTSSHHTSGVTTEPSAARPISTFEHGLKLSCPTALR
jgi:hypothetical protein